MTFTKKNQVFTVEESPIEGSMQQSENISRIFSKLLVAMKVSGILSSTSSSRIKRWFHNSYCLIVQLIVLANAIRLVFALIDPGTNWQYHIGVLCFVWTYTLISYISIGCLFSSNHIQIFLKSFDQYQKDYGIHFNIKKFNRIMNTITIISILEVVIANITIVAGFLFGLMSSTSIYSMNLWPMQMAKHYLLLAMCLIYGFVSIYNFASCITLVLFYFFVLSCITKEFGYISNSLVRLSEEKPEVITLQFEHFRQQHQAIINLLATANPILRHVAGGFYAMGIPAICFMLNGIASGSIPLEDFYKMLITVIGNLIGMFALTFKGAVLNCEAHRPLDILQSYDMSSLPDKLIHQMAIFSNRLTGPPIGVSVYGLFVVDSSTVLMIFGTIITYAVIAVQFSSSSEKCLQTFPSNITNITCHA